MSAFVWLDYSERERRKMLDVVDLFREHDIVLHKLRQGRPLTPTDLSELEKMLLDAGIGEADDKLTAP